MNLCRFFRKPARRSVPLYAPESYWRAGRGEREAVCNGCGPKGWLGKFVPNTIYCLDVSEVCNIHDWMYHVGRTSVDKEEADLALLNNLVRLIEAEDGKILRFLRRRRALKYYATVKNFGGPHFWNDKNPPITMF